MSTPPDGRRAPGIDRDSYEPAYAQLVRILSEEIAQGLYRPGDQLPSEGAQPLGAARDPLVTLSGSCGQPSARRQASEESLLAMAARSEWSGATAGKDSSLELAPLCCLAVTAAQNDSHDGGGQQIHRRFWDTPIALEPIDPWYNDLSRIRVDRECMCKP